MDVQTRHFASIHSTNTWARENLHNLSSAFVHVISADQQSSGRGRHGRQWLSPADVNLYITFVLPAFGSPADLTQLLALGIVLELEQEGVRGRIKWPNDVLIEGKKVAGILCEAVQQPREALVIGYGLNVNMQEQDLQAVDQAATSLAVFSGKNWHRALLGQSIQRRFLDDLESYRHSGFAKFEQAILARLYCS